MNRSFFTFALILSTATTAMAQPRDYKGGMQHTTLKPPAVTASKTGFSTESPTEEDTPQSRVWKKYKALATGQTEEQQNGKEEAKGQENRENALPKAPDAPQKPADATAQERAQEKPSPTGMAALIEEYRRSKSQRSQMRSIQITEPEKPNVAKPELKAVEQEKGKAAE